MKFVLASASPRRRELFALMGFEYTTVSTDIDESVQPGEHPTNYVLRLSREKAEVAAQNSALDTLVVACDTTVANGLEVLGKPADAAEARAMLIRLRGKVHTVYTAVTLLNVRSGQTVSEVATSPVRMREYTDEEISAYIASGDPFDKAGAYAIQHAGFHPVTGFDHCFANVMGLPLCHITRMMDRLGITPDTDVPTACQKALSYACPVYGRILSGGQ